MSNYARIVENVAVDVSTAPNDQFHPLLAQEFVPVPDEVQAGWVLSDGVWSAPAVTEAPEAPEVVQSYPSVGPIHFQMLFTSQEAVAAEGARATDPVLNRFWKLIEDPRTDVVNLGLQSVQDAVEHTLTVALAAGVELDVQARKAQILSGVLQ